MLTCDTCGDIKAERTVSCVLTRVCVCVCVSLTHTGSGYSKEMSKAFIDAEMALFAAQAKEVDM